MLGGAHTPRWGLLGIAAAGCCLLVLPPVSGAGRGRSLDRLRAQNVNLAARSRSAVLGLYSLDTRLTAAQARLSGLHEAAGRLEAQRALLGREIRLARVDARLSQDRLAARLRFLYDHGSTSSLDVVLGATSVVDAIDQLDDLDRVAAANQAVLVQVRSAKGRLVRLAREVDVRARALDATTREVGATVAALGRTRAERSAYVAALSRERALNAAQIARLAAQARAADARSQRLVEATPPRSQQASSPVSRLALPTRPPSVASGGKTLTVTATGYDLPGTTSTGLPVGWGIAAVDPSVIPLGTHLVIPGYGVAVAADTGSSIVGTRNRHLVPDSAPGEPVGRNVPSR